MFVTAGLTGTFYAYLWKEVPTMQNIKTLIEKNTFFVRIVAAMLVLVCTVAALSQTAFAKTTYVITDGDQVMVHTTYATDPADVLDEAGFELTDADTFETQAGNGVSEITVRRGMTVTIDYCGEKMQVVAYGETVGELFEALDIRPREISKVSASMEDVTFDGMEITISTTVLSTDNYTVSIPYETVYQETDLLKAGTEVVLVGGTAGQKVCSAEVTYYNGLETERVVLSEEIVSEPVSRVIAVGTGDGTKKNGRPIIGDGVIITGTGDVLTYTHKDVYKATSYCRTDVGGEITANGTVTRVGAIAVDPSVIPYGTRMFILTQDGHYVYGVATAEDCGGSIKGKRLDLFYETEKEANTFGIRYCDVYFLG